VWHTVVVTAIVAMFGMTVCYVFWRSLLTQVDDELRGHAAVVAGSLQPVDGGSFDLILPADALEYFQQEGADSPYYGIWAPDHRRIDVSDPQKVNERPRTFGVRTTAGRREFTMPGPAATTVLVGRDVSGIRAALRSLALTVAGTGIAAALLSVLGGWPLAGRALAPVARINRTARAMAAGDLRVRIPVEHTETELNQVALALNSAFDRLHAAIEERRRFTDDASHELRTPVATLSAETEWALQCPRAAEVYRDSLTTCRKAALRIGRIVEGLLTLSRADAGDLPLERVAIRIDRLVEDVAALVRPIAERSDVDIGTSVVPAVVMGDPDRLQEAVSNLVLNAVQYNRPGGRVNIQTDTAEAELVLRVQDTGTGIPSEHMPHVFDRFYRVDRSRGATRGAGLGLAITKWIVERHGGTIQCCTELGRGSEFIVRLPVA
jgi:heavy metal sensor kinase